MAGKLLKTNQNFVWRELVKRALPQNHLTICVQFYQNKQQGGKREQGGPTITEKGKRNTNHGHQSNGHTHVDEDVKENDRRNTVCITSTEHTSLSFRYGHDPE
jgi:hypothetical protein